jgi:hypothetical protein
LKKKEHLPAPKIGKTMGHGIDVGLNPLYDLK